MYGFSTGPDGVSRGLLTIKRTDSVYRVEMEQEEDGRWLAEITDLPGVLAVRPKRAVCPAPCAGPCVARSGGEDRERRTRYHPGFDSHLLRAFVSVWSAAKAKRVLAALLSIGWRIKRQSGSHKTLEHDRFPDCVFPFHDSEEIGPKMLARIAKRTGLRPSDL